MALKDSFTNLSKALRTTLQNVPAVVDTLIRGFDEIGDAVEAETTYSTDERVVGKWIDGSDVYEKVINFTNAIAATTGEWTDTGAKIEGATQIIDISALWETNGVCWEMVGGRINDTSKNIDVVSARPTYGTNITTIIVKYIKGTANRSPKNSAKNGGEDEADVKIIDEPATAPIEELKK